MGRKGRRSEWEGKEGGVSGERRREVVPLSNNSLEVWIQEF